MRLTLLTHSISWTWETTQNGRKSKVPRTAAPILTQAPRVLKAILLHLHRLVQPTRIAATHHTGICAEWERVQGMLPIIRDTSLHLNILKYKTQSRKRSATALLRIHRQEKWDNNQSQSRKLLDNHRQSRLARVNLSDGPTGRKLNSYRSRQVWQW